MTHTKALTVYADIPDDVEIGMDVLNVAFLRGKVEKPCPVCHGEIFPNAGGKAQADKWASILDHHLKAAKLEMLEAEAAEEEHSRKPGRRRPVPNRTEKA